MTADPLTKLAQCLFITIIFRGTHTHIRMYDSDTCFTCAIDVGDVMVVVVGYVVNIFKFFYENMDLHQNK